MGHAELSHHPSGSCDGLTEPSLFSSRQGNFLKIQMNSTFQERYSILSNFFFFLQGGVGLN